MSEPIYVHVNATITINNNDSSWYSPKISESVVFSIPEEMFVAGKLTTAVENRIKSMLKNYPEAIKEYEAQQKREKEEYNQREAEKAAKAKAEADEINERVENIVLSPS